MKRWIPHLPLSYCWVSHSDFYKLKGFADHSSICVFPLCTLCACCCRNSVQGVAKKPHTFFYGINPVSPTVSVMLAHKLTSLISLLNNILIILVLKEAKAITLACNPSVCVLSRQSKWHINIKVRFFARLWRVQGKISCAFKLIIYYQDPRAVRKVCDMIWFEESMSKCNCLHIFVSSYIGLRRPYIFSFTKKNPHWLVRLLYDWNELSYWHFQNLHKIRFLY